MTARRTGYEVMQGSLAKLPHLTADERATLINLATSLHERIETPVKLPQRLDLSLQRRPHRSRGCLSP